MVGVNPKILGNQAKFLSIIPRKPRSDARIVPDTLLTARVGLVLHATTAMAFRAFLA